MMLLSVSSFFVLFGWWMRELRALRLGLTTYRKEKYPFLGLLDDPNLDKQPGQPQATGQIIEIERMQ